MGGCIWRIMLDNHFCQRTDQQGSGVVLLRLSFRCPVGRLVCRRWAPQAERKLSLLLDYLVEEWGHHSKEKYLSKFKKAINQISDYPYSCPESTEMTGIFKCVVSKQSSFYYRLKNKSIEIITVFDNRQDQDYIFQQKWTSPKQTWRPTSGVYSGKRGCQGIKRNNVGTSDHRLLTYLYQIPFHFSLLPFHFCLSTPDYIRHCRIHLPVVVLFFKVVSYTNGFTLFL